MVTIPPLFELVPGQDAFSIKCMYGMGGPRGDGTDRISGVPVGVLCTSRVSGVLCFVWSVCYAGQPAGHLQYK